MFVMVQGWLRDEGVVYVRYVRKLRTAKKTRAVLARSQLYGEQWRTWRTMADNFGGKFWDTMKIIRHCPLLSAVVRQCLPPLSLVMMSD